MPEERKMTLKEKMAAAAAAPVAKVPASAKAQTRPEIKLDGSQASLLDDLCSYAELKDAVVSKMETVEGILKPSLLETVLRKWAAEGVRTDSFAVSSPNSSLLYSTTERANCFRIAPHQDGRPKKLEEFLAENQIPPDLAKNLMDEFDVREVQEITSPDDIEKSGDPVLADKVRLAILEALTPAEIKKVCQNKYEVKVKKGLLNRAPVFCKSLTPEESYSKLSKVVELTGVLIPALRNKKTKSVEKAIEELSKPQAPKTETPKEFWTTDKAYRLVADKDQMTIFDKEGVKKGVKQCEDHEHATNSARKYKTRRSVETLLNEMK